MACTPLAEEGRRWYGRESKLAFICIAKHHLLDDI